MANQNVSTLLIGGAEGHLGKSAVAFFAKRGLQVVGACRTGQDLERMTEFARVERLQGVTFLEADLGDERAVKRLVTDAEARVAPIDGLLNTAGGFRYGAVADTSLADLDFLMTANFKSSFLLARELVKGMAQRGFGRLVFVSSRATLGLGEANMGAYLASKAALNALILTLAAEHKKAGVTANAIMPQTIDTPANRAAMPKANFSDWATPEALLEVVAGLLGASGALVNGALIPVGGRL